MKEYTFSEFKNFAVRADIVSHHLYVNKEIGHITRIKNEDVLLGLVNLVRDKHEPSIFFGQTELIPFRYKHRTSAFNDCLQFAESISLLGRHGYSEDVCILQEKKSKSSFGESDEDNIDIAVRNYQDYDANPNIGEAYAVVKTKLTSGTPYHIALVIFKDGTSNITIEVDASVPISYPMFEIYDTQSKQDTFHSRYKSVMKPAHTIVLSKRNLSHPEFEEVRRIYNI